MTKTGGSQEEFVQTLIKSILPKTQIISIKKFNEGYNNDAYDIQLSKQRLVLKLIRGNVSNARKEVAILKSLAKTTLPVPEVIRFNLTSKNPYVLLEYLDGVPLSIVFDKVNNIPQIIEQLGELKAIMNRKKYPFFGKINSTNKETDRYKKLSTHFDAEIQKTFQKLHKSQAASFVKELEAFWTKHKLIFDEDHGPYLCHGDTSLPNILVKKQGRNWKITGLLDFEYASSGGAASDLYSSPKSFLQIAPYLDYLEKGYKKIASLPKNWKKILWLSIWHRSVQWLELLPSMNWKELSQNQVKERKQKLKDKLITVMTQAKKAIEGGN